MRGPMPPNFPTCSVGGKEVNVHTGVCLRLRLGARSMFQSCVRKEQDVLYLVVLYMLYSLV